MEREASALLDEIHREENYGETHSLPQEHLIESSKQIEEENVYLGEHYDS
jgi:hypothetical protein